MKLPNVALDDVHPDAASGYVSHLFRRTEAGEEDQLQRSAIVHRLRRTLSDEPFLERLLPESCRVHSMAVVLDLDDDIITLVVGLQGDLADAGLASLRADFRRLDAVVHGIAHKVDKRIGDLLDHRLVQLRVLALQHQLGLLAFGSTDVAHHSREPLEDRPDGHHPNRHGVR